MNKTKRLGQHFLKNRKILEEMVDASELTKKDIVLEIGPGTGTLTAVLAEKTRRVIAVEKDGDLIPALKAKFGGHKNVEIIRGDILKIGRDPSLFHEISKNYKIAANIPYYITSRFLRLFLSQTKFRPKFMLLMVQREVADRIMARDEKESLLSLSVKAYAKPQIIRYVAKGNFSPPPKVDSAIITISKISNAFFKKNKIDEKRFFEILRTAFQQKRKMLKHSLKSILSTSDVHGFGYKRPQELSLSDWIKIYIGTKNLR